LYFLNRLKRNLLKINKKSSTVFEKKMKKDGKKYKLKNWKKKIIFAKYVPKRFAPKWAMPIKAKTKQAAPKWSHHKVVYSIGYAMNQNV